MSEGIVETLGLKRITRLLLDHGSTPSFADVWSGYARPALEFRYAGMEERDETELGCTKLGGVPDLEVGAAWPVRPAYDARSLNEYSPESGCIARPLSFLAQVNLADVKQQGGCGVSVPEAGLLQVFYDTEVQPWGYRPGHRIGTVIRYVPAGSDLAKARLPDSDWPLVDPVAKVRLAPAVSLPHWRWLECETTERLGWTEDVFLEELDHVDEDIFELLTYPRHTMGGWPALVQLSPIEEQCEFVSGGQEVEKMSELNEEQWKVLRCKAQAWRQLFQFGGDENTLDWTGGDDGVHLYMMMRDRDVVANSFDKAHAVFQCT